MAEAESVPPLQKDISLARAIVLSGLILAILLWLDRHLGMGLGTLQSAAVVTVATFAIGLVQNLLSKAEVEVNQTTITNALRRIFSTPVLILLVVTTCILAASFASVVVIESDASGHVKGGKLQLKALDRSDWSMQAPTARSGVSQYFLVPTSPFGRSLRLEVPGYLPRTVTVYPLVGERIDPERDLIPSPSLLLRLDPRGFPSISGDRARGIRLRISQVEGEGRSTLLGCGPMNSASMLAGPLRRVDSEVLASWREDLIAMGIDESQRALSLRRWRKTSVFPLGRPLLPGSALRAEAISRESGCIIASASFRLGFDGLHDQLMEASNDPASCGDSLMVGCSDDPAGLPGGR